MILASCCHRQMSLLPSSFVSSHDSDNSEGVKGTHHQSPNVMESDNTSVSSSPPGGREGYVPSMLEQHTATHVVDLHKLGTYCVHIWCYYIYIYIYIYIHTPPGILGTSSEELYELEAPAAMGTVSTSKPNQLDEFDFYN